MDVLNEKDLHVGDYVMVFPNPDFHHEDKQPETSITYEELMPRFIKAMPFDTQSKKIAKHQEMIKYAF